jgi:SPP1 family predicted phage head-tail adaptor
VVRKSGNEYVTNGIGNDSATYTFLIRYRADVDEKAKVKFEGREYNITFIAEPVRKSYLELTTERLKN